MPGLEDLITSGYKQFLGRDPEEGAVASWLPEFEKDPEKGLAGIAGSEEARNRRVSGLNKLLGDINTAPSRLATQTTEAGDAFYNQAADVINQTAGDQANAQAESLFSRGVGRGTILPYALGRLEEGRKKALGTARQAATAGAGAEARANQEALRRLYETELGGGFRNRQLDLAERQINNQAGQFLQKLNLSQDELEAMSDAQLERLLLGGGVGLGSLLFSSIPAGGSTVGGSLLSGLGGLWGSLFGSGAGAGASLASDFFV